ncbi:MAG: hypothetical protein QM778_34005 [Myxococcales bacterium]
MKRALAWLAGTLLVPSAVLAVSTKSFVIDTNEAFEKGKFEGAASHSGGTLTRGMSSKRVPLEGVPVAYSSAVGPDGAIYVGTGNDGAVYRVTADGAKLFADTDAAVITSLMWVGDVLYAGSLPGGRIFTVDAKGAAKELVKLEGADHIWGLAFDAKKSTVYAATGPQGKLFALSGGAVPRLVHDDSAEHLLCLEQDELGRLYVGTSNGARLLRVEDSGTPKVSVLHDFPGQEITTLDVASGFIAVASNDFPDLPAASPDASKDLGSARLRRPKPGKGKLYTLGFDGQLDELYASDTGHISALEIESSGQAVQVGLAQEGRVVRVERNGDRATWADADERQVVALHLLGKAPHFVTSDGVAVYRVEANAKDGLWTSAALDAKVPARFGELSFRARGTLRWATRSGNTETPDDSWSAWSAESATQGPIKSAAARFLQVRLSLVGDAELYALNAYYLPQNQQAQLRHVRTRPGKTPDAKGGLPPHKSIVSLTWEVDNPDEDRLRYRVFFRQEAHATWLPALREHEPLEQTEYEWETRTLPDGFYRVRVEASDENSNPVAFVRRSEAFSGPILVDNHGPEIIDLKVQGKQLSGTARDALGPIHSLELSFDGAPYLPISSVDGLLDTREERFAVDLSALAPGTHIGSVRASDAAYNVTAASIEFQVQR